MNRQTTKTLRERLAFRQNKETGMSIVEILVASVIILFLLISLGVGSTQSYKTSAGMENRTKAANFANEVTAVARQSEFKRLYLPAVTSTPTDTYGDGKCSANTTSVPNATMEVVTKGTGTPFPGLAYCQVKQAGDKNGAVGTKFYIQTQVYYFTSTGITTTPTAYAPKRVIVTIRWSDVTTAEGKWSTYQKTITVAPGPEDCIPDSISSSGTIPLGCRTA